MYLIPIAFIGNTQILKLWYNCKIPFLYFVPSIQTYSVIIIFHEFLKLQTTTEQTPFGTSIASQNVEYESTSSYNNNNEDN